jgi:hypothetical protein
MPSSKRRSRRNRSRPGGTLVFSRRNYVLLAIGIALVAVGFALMRIDNQFEGFLSLNVAPLIILGGYLEIIYAILWRPSDGETDDPAAEKTEKPTTA